jgi:biopolymer transport protein ExbB/TolQ
MKQRMSSEFIYQLFALLIAVIVVHAVYVGAIRPSADAQIQREMALQAAGEDYVPERSFTVVIRDFEQEACFILLIWALSIMGYKARRAMREQELLDRRLLDIPEGTSVLPEDSREYSRSLEALPDAEQDYLLPRTLLSALQRFATTGSIYIAWAIPSVGFIGTVRGIGEALGQAYKAVEGDISGVTVSLGVAFNSTFVALVLSIIIMFCLHQLQLSQERLVLDCQRYAGAGLPALRRQAPAAPPKAWSCHVSWPCCNRNSANRGARREVWLFQLNDE